MLDELVPPVEILKDGSGSADAFKAYGEGFVRHVLIDYARLSPSERVLDLGCGNGQKARALVPYLSSSGSYEGLDINRVAVEWCQEHYTPYPNFHFQVADVHNGVYNPGGKQQDATYRLPYSDNEFDLVFLVSVFTHMLPAGVANYINEVARVLKQGGRCVASFFLLNQESMGPIMAGTTRIVRFPHSVATYRISNMDYPTAGVALDETWVRSCFLVAGLTVAAVMRGNWSGAGYLRVGLQDNIIAAKATPPG